MIDAKLCRRGLFTVLRKTIPGDFQERCGGCQVIRGEDLTRMPTAAPSKNEGREGLLMQINKHRNFAVHKGKRIIAAVFKDQRDVFTTTGTLCGNLCRRGVLRRLSKPSGIGSKNDGEDDDERQKQHDADNLGRD